NEYDECPRGDLAQQQQLVPAALLAHILQYRSAPYFRGGKDCGQCTEQDGETRPEHPQHVAVLAPDDSAPVCEVLAILPKQDRLLAQGNGDGRRLREEPGQCVELTAKTFERRAVRTVGRCGELIASDRKLSQLLIRCRPNTEKDLLERLRTLIDVIDGARFL